MDPQMIRFMAGVHRDMDSGKIKHVVLDGEKMPVSDEVMNEFGLVTGQTINKIIFAEIIKKSLAIVAAKEIIEKAKEGGMKT